MSRPLSSNPTVRSMSAQATRHGALSQAQRNNAFVPRRSACHSADNNAKVASEKRADSATQRQNTAQADSPNTTTQQQHANPNTPQHTTNTAPSLPTSNRPGTPEQEADREAALRGQSMALLRKESCCHLLVATARYSSATGVPRHKRKVSGRAEEMAEMRDQACRRRDSTNMQQSRRRRNTSDMTRNTVAQAANSTLQRATQFKAETHSSNHFLRASPSAAAAAVRNRAPLDPQRFERIPHWRWWWAGSATRSTTTQNALSFSKSGKLAHHFKHHMATATPPQAESQETKVRRIPFSFRRLEALAEVVLTLSRSTVWFPRGIRRVSLLLAPAAAPHGEEASAKWQERATRQWRRLFWQARYINECRNCDGIPAVTAILQHVPEQQHLLTLLYRHSSITSRSSIPKCAGAAAPKSFTRSFFCFFCFSPDLQGIAKSHTPQSPSQKSFFFNFTRLSARTSQPRVV